MRSRQGSWLREKAPPQPTLDISRLLDYLEGTTLEFTDGVNTYTNPDDIPPLHIPLKARVVGPWRGITHD